LNTSSWSTAECRSVIVHRYGKPAVVAMAGDRDGRCKPRRAGNEVGQTAPERCGPQGHFRRPRKATVARCPCRWVLARSGNPRRVTSLGVSVESRLLTKTSFRFLAPAASSNFPPWGWRRSRHNIRKRENSGRVQRCGGFAEPIIEVNTRIRWERLSPRNSIE
jgi:hypothetical protein